MPFQVNQIAAQPSVSMGGSTFGEVVLTNTADLFEIGVYVPSGAAKNALLRNGVQYQVSSGKTLKIVAVRHYGYINVHYANNAGLTTGLVTMSDAGWAFGTGTGQNGCGPLIFEIPSLMYPYCTDPTSGSAGGNVTFLCYEY